jgi:hypothetical protein
LATGSFKFLDVEGFSYEDNKWVKLIGVKENSHKDSAPTILQSNSTLKITCYGVCTGAIRISFVSLKKNIREMQLKSQVERHDKARYHHASNPLDGIGLNPILTYRSKKWRPRRTWRPKISIISGRK